MAGVKDDAAAQVLQQFRIVLNVVKSHFQQVERTTGVSGSQVWALSVIQNKPGISVGELASALSVKQPTASVLARNLAHRGLVEARPVATDRRAVALHPLPGADRVLSQVPGPRSGVLPEALVTLDGETLERMRADLGRLITLLKADARIGAMPLDRI